MKPTESASVPVRNASASSGVAVKVDVGGGGRRPVAVFRDRAVGDARHEPATSFFPWATTNSTVWRHSRDRSRIPANRSSSYSPSGTGVVDERARERELLPREHLADDVVRQPHPEALGVDLRAVREQRLPALVQEVADVDQGREVVVAVRVEAALEPRRVRALLAPRRGTPCAAPSPARSTTPT